MIRLAIPLLLVALLAWGLLYGVRGKVKEETLGAMKGGCIALSIAAAVLLLIGAIFSLRGFING